MSEAEERARVVAVAKTYLLTPYVDEGMVKGSGVDCGTFPILAYAEAGLIERFRPPHHSPQWFLHADEEIYLNLVLERTREIDGPPLPGDMVLYKVGRLYAHGAIVVEWPMIIHAVKHHGVLFGEGDRGEWGDQKKHPRRFFSKW